MILGSLLPPGPQAGNVVADSTKAVMNENYGVRTLTSWVLEQERKGNIDNELGVVITSTALACKQIATLVNRSGISNLTGERLDASITIISSHIGSRCAPPVLGAAANRE